MKILKELLQVVCPCVVRLLCGDVACHSWQVSKETAVHQCCKIVDLHSVLAACHLAMLACPLKS
jgi:hypothetical protein